MKSRLLSITALSLVLSACAGEFVPSTNERDSAQTPRGVELAIAGLKPAIQSAWLRVPDSSMIEIASQLCEPAHAVRAPTPVALGATRRWRAVRHEPVAPVERARPQPGESITYQISARRLGIPITITQRVVERRGARMVLDQIIDDGFVEPVELRLRVDESPDSADRLVSVARMERGVQLPYGTSAYLDLMTLLAPPVERLVASAPATLASVQIGQAVIECESTGYEVRVDEQVAAMTVKHGPSFAWGNVGTEVRAASGDVIYKSEIIALGDVDPHAWSLIAMQTGADPDYETWEARLVAAQRAVDGEYDTWEADIDAEAVAALLQLAAAEAQYDTWDAESQAVHTPVLVGMASAEADYEAWDAASGWHPPTLRAPAYASEPDYEAWDAEMGGSGAPRQLFAHGSEADYDAWEAEGVDRSFAARRKQVEQIERTAAAIATRDDSDDYEDE